MQARYHVEITRAALGPWFDEADLQAIIQANLSQDRLRNLVFHPELHFDGGALHAAEAYIERERRLIVDITTAHGDRRIALAALGRLIHTRQDFYAHSNWCALWVEQHGGLERASPDGIEICAGPLETAGLFSGKASVFHYLASRAPLYGGWHRRHLLPPDDHEAMNLDDPGRGPLFYFARAAALKHTVVELEMLLAAVEQAGGDAAWLLGEAR
jgi:hypothetical protein